MTPLVKEMVALDPEVGLDFTWFDIGAVPEYGNYEAETALRNDPLPFHRCAVCGLDAEGRKFLLLVVAQPKVSGGGQLMVVHGWVMRVDELHAALTEARKWIGDGPLSDGLDREYWTPEYIAAVDMVDAVLGPNVGGNRRAD